MRWYLLTKLNFLSSVAAAAGTHQHTTMAVAVAQADTEQVFRARPLAVTHLLNLC
jgi:hypothetical protein